MFTSEHHQTARILVVDDEATNVRLLTRLLGRAGYRNVCGLTDPRDFEERMTSFEPDLVLLDVLMHHADGYTVMECLRSKAGSDRVPVLVLTADVTPEAKRRAFAAGADDYLTKPFDVEDVLLRVRNMLESRSRSEPQLAGDGSPLAGGRG